MTIRIIQAGLGGWGRNWASNVVPKNKHFEAVAYVDSDASMLQLAQKDGGVAPERCFTTLEEAFSAYEADAVLITASLPAHVPLALTALNAGKHVLLEKPFAPTIAEARQVVKTAAERNRVLIISQNYRFHPAVLAVSELLRSGELGRLGAVNIDFRRYDNTAPDSHIHYKIWEPLLADMSIHHFDLMCVLLGAKPREVACQSWNTPWSKYIEPATATATISFENGAVVSYRGSWTSTGPQTSWAGEWHMECEKGEIIWTSRDDDVPDSVTVHLMGEQARKLTLPEVPLIDRHGSLEAFAQAVNTGKISAPACSGEENLKTLALMFAAIEAARQHGPVALAQ
ncbi:Gfo/Idh/MocA family oxidoreductase [Ktedonosporobacter rubrisoli]|uniref:Gfo/Idh/MocA family oxidoreductase n=1 Tax=Ktedonosporobacter rubrisoli TaxID=2509675 RepID=A0A4P6JTE0_KTERU|nr:Gfo/Idh/MocA family oxidoreductase [Ktedonosporobacter rubrisoli]QBD78837.1 Gfo/Idh/MocA family oxidoreductase [Ktedonosporobacter rubrisoli]